MFSDVDPEEVYPAALKRAPKPASDRPSSVASSSHRVPVPPLLPTPRSDTSLEMFLKLENCHKDVKGAFNVAADDEVEYTFLENNAARPSCSHTEGQELSSSTLNHLTGPLCAQTSLANLENLTQLNPAGSDAPLESRSPRMQKYGQARLSASPAKCAILVAGLSHTSVLPLEGYTEDGDALGGDVGQHVLDPTLPYTRLTGDAAASFITATAVDDGGSSSDDNGARIRRSSNTGNKLRRRSGSAMTANKRHSGNAPTSSYQSSLPTMQVLSWIWDVVNKIYDYLVTLLCYKSSKSRTRRRQHRSISLVSRHIGNQGGAKHSHDIRSNASGSPDFAQPVITSAIIGGLEVKRGMLKTDNGTNIAFQVWQSLETPEKCIDVDIVYLPDLGRTSGCRKSRPSGLSEFARTFVDSGYRVIIPQFIDNEDYDIAGRAKSLASIIRHFQIDGIAAPPMPASYRHISPNSHQNYAALEEDVSDVDSSQHYHTDTASRRQMSRGRGGSVVSLQTFLSSDPDQAYAAIKQATLIQPRRAMRPLFIVGVGCGALTALTYPLENVTYPRSHRSIPSISSMPFPERNAPQKSKVASILATMRRSLGLRSPTRDLEEARQVAMVPTIAVSGIVAIGLSLDIRQYKAVKDSAGGSTHLNKGGSEAIASAKSYKLAIENIHNCARRIRVPVLIVHGTKSSVRSISRINLLYQSLQSTDCTLVFNAKLCHDSDIERSAHISLITKDVFSWMGERILRGRVRFSSQGVRLGTTSTLGISALEDIPLSSHRRLRRQRSRSESFLDMDQAGTSEDSDDSAMDKSMESVLRRSSSRTAECRVSTESRSRTFYSLPTGSSSSRDLTAQLGRQTSILGPDQRHGVHLFKSDMEGIEEISDSLRPITPLSRQASTSSKHSVGDGHLAIPTRSRSLKTTESSKSRSSQNERSRSLTVSSCADAGNNVVDTEVATTVSKAMPPPSSRNRRGLSISVMDENNSDDVDHDMAIVDYKLTYSPGLSDGSSSTPSTPGLLTPRLEHFDHSIQSQPRDYKNYPPRGLNIDVEGVEDGGGQKLFALVQRDHVDGRKGHVKARQGSLDVGIPAGSLGLFF